MLSIILGIIGVIIILILLLVLVAIIAYAIAFINALICDIKGTNNKLSEWFTDVFD